MVLLKKKMFSGTTLHIGFGSATTFNGEVDFFQKKKKKRGNNVMD
jgi:hypothetical protein